MTHRLPTSLIITTYNWPEALRLTLRSVLRQSLMPGEVIIADDGSDPDTARAVKEVLGPTQLTWRHVWHQRKGVRQSRIKNLAVNYSQNPYLIFIDQDVVLHHEFVADHVSMAEEGVFLQGKRALLPKEYTKKILTHREFIPPSFGLRGLRNRKNTFRFLFLARILARAKGFETSLRGCNLSMFRADFLDADGFDESFDGSWGREDSDICFRLFHNGLKIKNLWFSALQYHLYHGRTNTWDRERLDAQLEQNIREKRKKALKGFSRLSSDGEIIGGSHPFRAEVRQRHP